MQSSVTVRIGGKLGRDKEKGEAPWGNARRKRRTLAKGTERKSQAQKGSESNGVLYIKS